MIREANLSDLMLGSAVSSFITGLVANSFEVVKTRLILSTKQHDPSHTLIQKIRNEITGGVRRDGLQYFAKGISWHAAASTVKGVTLMPLYEHSNDDITSSTATVEL